MIFNDFVNILASQHFNDIFSYHMMHNMYPKYADMGARKRLKDKNIGKFHHFDVFP